MTSPRPLYYSSLLFVFALVGVVPGVPPTFAQEARAAGTTPIPAEGKAVVVFFRPATGTAFIDGARHTLFEIKESHPDPQPFGIGGGGTKIAYHIEPGKHLFMVVGENAEYMTADLLPNSTYHVTVAVSAGRWRARYALRKTDAQDLASNDFKELLASSRWTESSATAQTWAASNMPSIKRRHAQYYSLWTSKPESERAALLPNDRVSAR